MRLRHALVLGLLLVSTTATPLVAQRRGGQRSDPRIARMEERLIRLQKLVERMARKVARGSGEDHAHEHRVRGEGRREGHGGDRRIAELTERVARLEEHLSGTTQRIARLAQALEVGQKRREAEHRAAARRQLERRDAAVELKTENARLSATVAELKEALNRRQTRGRDTARRIEHLEARLAERTAQTQDLENRAAVMQQMRADMEAQMKQLQIELQRMADRADQSKKREAEITDLSEQMAVERNNAVRRIQSLQQHIDELEQRTVRSEQRTHELEKALVAREKKLAQREAMIEELQVLRAELDAMRAKSANDRKNHEQVSRSRAELMERLRMMEMELARREADSVAATQNARQTVDRMNRRVAELEAACAAANAQKQKSRDTLAEQAAEARALRNRLASLENSIKVREAKLDQRTAEMMKLKKMLIEQQTHLERGQNLRNELETLKAQNKDLQAVIKKLRRNKD